MNNDPYEIRRVGYKYYCACALTRND